MSYVLHLPPDTRQQIRDYLTAIEADSSSYRAVRDAILDELSKIRLNPRLGTPVYGGPLETRRILRFSVNVGSENHDLQFVYKVYEANRTVVVSGFDETPDP